MRSGSVGNPILVRGPAHLESFRAATPSRCGGSGCPDPIVARIHRESEELEGSVPTADAAVDVGDGGCGVSMT